MHRRFVLPYCLIAACLIASVSCGSSQVGQIRGTVAVDGQPVEEGTISFRPTASSAGKSAGAAINAGQFQLPSNHGLAPGSYSVAVQALKNSGRTFNDPMKGEVPVLIPLELVDSPKDVELAGENAGELKIEMTSAAGSKSAR